MPDPVATQSFRDALAQFASGVTVVAARDAGGLTGLTATAFCSVSLDPALVLVSVARTASAHDRIVRADRLGISVLTLDQAWIAQQFAQHGVDRFLGVRLDPDRGVPLIVGALAHLECTHHAAHLAGDHTLLVVEVVESTAFAGAPLVHHGRTLGGFSAVPKKGDGAREEPTPASHPRRA